jgi:hypothetical protein
MTERLIHTALGPRRTSVAIDAAERIERKADQLAREAAKAAPTPPKSPLDEALDHLALKLGDGSWLLPTAFTIHRELDLDGDERAIAVSCNGVKWTLREAYDLGLISLDGRASQDRLAIIIQSKPANGLRGIREEMVARQALSQLMQPGKWTMR